MWNLACKDFIAKFSSFVLRIPRNDNHKQQKKKTAAIMPLLKNAIMCPFKQGEKMARKQLKTLKKIPPPADNKTLLTILMPLYNQEPSIKDALNSILMQETNYKYELIISDDASTDGSLKIAKEYQAKYPDIIKILVQEVGDIATYFYNFILKEKK